MSIKIVMTYNNLPQIAKKMPGEVSAVLRKIGKDVEADAKARLEGSRHGRIYKVSKTGKTHQASAPGEAPANDIGNLQNSIKMKVESPTRVIVYVGAKYGMSLEYGNKRGMLARPFMRPAVEKIRPSFIAAMKALEAQLR